MAALQEETITRDTTELSAVLQQQTLVWGQVLPQVQNKNNGTCQGMAAHEMMHLRDKPVSWRA